MNRPVVVLFAILCTSIPLTDARASSEIVVAIRYLQPVGVSHAHLYLYREDGKLLRQLTHDNTGQDLRPVFSPDGETIVFARGVPKAPPEYWSVRPRGSDLHRLKTPPNWYRNSRESPFFTNIEAKGPDAGFPSEAGQPAVNPTFRSPDGATEFVLRTVDSDEDDHVDGPGHGKHYVLRDLKSGRETEMGKLPGFEGLFELLHLRQEPSQSFLIDAGMRLAFFGLHLDSTAGDTSYALDLSNPRLVRLSPNWAAPIPLPGEPAFLTLTSVRYVPISGSKMTANCSYMERRDAKLRKVRYARAGAAICYGASMYRQGKTPAVIVVYFGYN